VVAALQRHAPPAQHRLAGELVDGEAVRVDEAVERHLRPRRAAQPVDRAPPRPGKVVALQRGAQGSEMPRRPPVVVVQIGDMPAGGEVAQHHPQHAAVPGRMQPAMPHRGGIAGVDQQHAVVGRAVAAGVLDGGEAAARHVDADQRLHGAGKILREHRAQRLGDGRAQQRRHHHGDVEAAALRPELAQQRRARRRRGRRRRRLANEAGGDPPQLRPADQGGIDMPKPAVDECDEVALADHGLPQLRDVPQRRRRTKVYITPPYLPTLRPTSHGTPP